MVNKNEKFFKDWYWKDLEQELVVYLKVISSHSLMELSPS
jgi:hypothetical protein